LGRIFRPPFKEALMEVVYARCCGLDVHKKGVAACVLMAEGGRREKHQRRFGTMTAQLEALAEWLQRWGVTHVAMESTGVYWKPVWNVLEGRFELLLANAQHIKAVPGRKTDQKDSEWMAELLQHGLLRGSFVPPQEVRQLRDLVRLRLNLVEDANRAANRIQQVLEDANIKLGSVATDVLGCSGRQMLRAMIEGPQRAAELADLAVGRLRGKKSALEAALEGRLSDHHRFLLRQLLEQVEFLEQRIAAVEAELGRRAGAFEETLGRLETIPGVKRRTAWALLAETGEDMGRFGSAQRLASWAGVCPGNHESAGKHYSGRTRRGNRSLRRGLCQAAWAAAATHDTYLSALYHRLAARRGKKRAIMAVAHAILVIAYHLIARRQTYQELGANHFDLLHAERLKRRLVRRLEGLGHRVILEPLAPAA
jgi:transposase